MTNEVPSNAQTTIWNHITQLRKFFLNFDDDDSGTMSVEEMSNFVRRLGKSPSEEELAEVLDVVSPDRLEIDFAGFIELISGSNTDTQKYIQRQIVEYRDAFRLFDPDKDGAVTHEEFVIVLNLFGEAIAQNSEALLNEIDEDGSGDIDFIEFLGMMTCNDSPAQSKLRSQIVSFREMFNMFDSQNNGKVTAQNFHEGMLALHMPMEMSEIILIMQRVTSSGSLDYTFFVLLFAGARKDSLQLPLLCQLNELREAFAVCDVDGSGSLDVDEIGETLTAMGAERTRPEVEKMVAEVDEDGSGELDFFEFMMLMGRTLGSANEDAAAAAKARQAGTPSMQLQELLETPDRSQARATCVDEIVKLLRSGAFGAIKHVEGLGCGDEAMCRKLANEITLKTFEPGEVLQHQNAPQDDMLLILSGTVDLWSHSEQVRLLNKHTGVNALWCVLEPACNEMLSQCRQFEQNFVAQCQLEAHANQSTPIALFVMETQHIARALFDWTKKAAAWCSSEFVDLRLCEPLMGSAVQLIHDLRVHTASCDAIRSTLIVRRTSLQFDGSGEQAKVANEKAIAVTKTMLIALQLWLVTFEKAFGMVRLDLSEDRSAAPTASMHIIHNEVPPGAKVSGTEAGPLEDKCYGLRLAELISPHCLGIPALVHEDVPAPLTVSTRINGMDRAKEGELVWNRGQQHCSVVCARISRASYLEAKAVAPLKLLSQLQMCTGFSLNEKRKLALQMEQFEVQRGEPVVQRGELATCVLIVHKGQLTIKLDVDQMQAETESVQGQLVQANSAVRELELSLVDEAEARRTFMMKQFHNNKRKLKIMLEEVDRLTTQLSALLHEGATVSSPAGLSQPMLSQHHTSVQPATFDAKQPKFRKRRKSIAIIGELDVLHECTTGNDGTPVWVSDFYVDSNKALLWKLPRAAFNSAEIQKNLMSTKQARAECRKERVKSSVGLLTLPCDEDVVILPAAEDIQVRDYTQMPASDEDISKLQKLKDLDAACRRGQSPPTSVVVRAFGQKQMEFDVLPDTKVHELHQAILEQTAQDEIRPMYLMHNGEWLKKNSTLSQCGVLKEDPRTRVSAHYTPPVDDVSSSISLISSPGPLGPIIEIAEPTDSDDCSTESSIARELLGQHDELPSAPPSRSELVRKKSIRQHDDQYFNGRWLGYANRDEGVVKEVTRPWSERTARVPIKLGRQQSDGFELKGADKPGKLSCRPDPLAKAEALANWDGDEPIVRIKGRKPNYKEHRPWTEGQAAERAASGQVSMLEQAHAARVQRMKSRGTLDIPNDRPSEANRSSGKPLPLTHSGSLEIQPLPLTHSGTLEVQAAAEQVRLIKQAVASKPNSPEAADADESAAALKARIMAITVSSSDDENYEPSTRSFETPEITRASQLSANVADVDLFGDTKDVLQVTVTSEELAVDCTDADSVSGTQTSTLIQMPAVQMDGVERRNSDSGSSQAPSEASRPVTRETRGPFSRPATRGAMGSLEHTSAPLGHSEAELASSDEESNDWTDDDDDYGEGFEWLAFYDQLNDDSVAAAHDACSPFADLPSPKQQQRTTSPTVVRQGTHKCKKEESPVRVHNHAVPKASAFLPPLSQRKPDRTSPHNAALRNFSRVGGHPTRQKMVRLFALEMDGIAAREVRFGQLAPVAAPAASNGFSGTLRAIVPHEYVVSANGGLVMTPCT